MCALVRLRASSLPLRWRACSSSAIVWMPRLRARMLCLRAVAWLSDLPAGEAGVLERGLDSLDTRMQAHFDHARALAEYLAANEMVRNVRYPG